MQDTVFGYAGILWGEAPRRGQNLVRRKQASRRSRPPGAHRILEPLAAVGNRPTKTAAHREGGRPLWVRPASAVRIGKVDQYGQFTVCPVPGVPLMLPST